jgi:hypothetical protein
LVPAIASGAEGKFYLIVAIDRKLAHGAPLESLDKDAALMAGAEHRSQGGQRKSSAK